jgi:ABC-2 type transport system ATP-binding protein
LRLHVSRRSPELVARLGKMPGVTEARQNGDSIDLYADRGGPLIGPVAAAVAESGSELFDVHISEPSLENLFLHHTGRSLRQ